MPCLTARVPEGSEGDPGAQGWGWGKAQVGHLLPASLLQGQGSGVAQPSVPPGCPRTHRSVLLPPRPQSRRNPPTPPRPSWSLPPSAGCGPPPECATSGWPGCERSVVTGETRVALHWLSQGASLAMSGGWALSPRSWGRLLLSCLCLASPWDLFSPTVCTRNTAPQGPRTGSLEPRPRLVFALASLKVLGGKGGPTLLRTRCVPSAVFRWGFVSSGPARTQTQRPHSPGGAGQSRAPPLAAPPPRPPRLPAPHLHIPAGADVRFKQPPQVPSLSPAVTQPVPRKSVSHAEGLPGCGRRCALCSGGSCHVRSVPTPGTGDRLGAPAATPAQLWALLGVGAFFTQSTFLSKAANTSWTEPQAPYS